MIFPIKRIIAALFLLFPVILLAKPAAEYLDRGLNLNPQIPAPETILGWNVGEWHVRPDQLVRYMEVLAEASPRVSLTVTGHSHEQRPLLLLSITSENNQPHLESLRQDHIDSHGAQGPLVLYMGYGVHGDEASGSNAAMLFAYYLAAAQDQWLDEVLQNTVILLDPSLNPDGLGRFAQWVNGNRSKHPVADPNSQEHHEPIPTGRVNHYWFDLNRDWLLLQHPESRARIAQFHRWRPHVLTDFHEHGPNNNYFFQPGVPNRQNPLTPDRNLELTRALARYHAQALDREGQLYFSEERFDDYYYGKGSTYPDVLGTIGILFEQPSSAGHLIETDNGLLPFEKAVSNQLTTSLSTLRGAWSLRNELMQYQKGFIESERDRGRDFGQSAWVFGDDGDPVRAQAFRTILDQHGIHYQTLNESLSANGFDFQTGQAWVIPAAQDKASLIQAIMETRTEFADETFYDVSTWTLPLAFNLPYASLRRMPAMGGDNQTAAPAGISQQNTVAWAVSWGHGHAPRLLAALMKAELPVKSLTETVTAQGANGNIRISAGDLILPLGQMNQAETDTAQSLLEDYNREYGIPIHNIRTALTPSGVDIGSPKSVKLDTVKPLLVAGRGINAYEAGEIWHLLDTRVDLPPVIIPPHQLGRIDLDDYSHLIMVHRYSGEPSDGETEKIEQWISGGGILIATKSSATWAEQLFQDEDTENKEKEDTEEEPERRPYGDFEKDQAQRVVGGAIVRAELDLSHPLAFGYRRSQIPLFRNGTVLLEPSDNPYTSVAQYTEDPLISGFIGDERLEEIRGKPAMIAERKGAGLIVRMANNPSFRAYWYGTQRLFINALFFGQLVENTEMD